MTAVRTVRLVAGIALGALILGGCARFDDSASSEFSPAPSLHGANIEPDKPGQSPTSTTPPSGPCIDRDPAVVATCLDTTGGITVLPGGAAALVTERRTGRILRVVPKQPVIEVGQVDVDDSSDGGLTDIALSPTYHEDGLIYAYLTTGSDNRVVRIADGGPPKPILTGIPKGPQGNRGAITFTPSGQLWVLTGNAGDPGAADNSATLAGKLLRVDSPSATSPASPHVAVSGIGTVGDVCLGPGEKVWITDRTPTRDRLQRLDADGTVTTAWTWPDRPGVAGCAAQTDQVSIALTHAKALAIAAVEPGSFAVTTAPSLAAKDKYGQLGAAAAGKDALWVATVNKDEGGEPGPNDDRVVRITPDATGGGPD